MASTMFMRVDEVAEELGVSVPYAYKTIMRRLIGVLSVVAMMLIDYRGACVCHPRCCSCGYPHDARRRR